jgi:hypothetical protein
MVAALIIGVAALLTVFVVGLVVHMAVEEWRRDR